MHGMQNKPGYLTTEFYVTVVTAFASLVAAIDGGLPPKYAAIGAAIVSGAYTISRGIAKFGPTLISLLSILPTLTAVKAGINSETKKPGTGAGMTLPSWIPGFLIPLSVAAALGLSGCGMNTAGIAHSAAATVGTDVYSDVAAAIQAYVELKAGNEDMAWSLAKGANALRDYVKTSADVKALVAAWTGNTGDSQTLLAKLSRVTGLTSLSPDDQAAVIASAAQDVASNPAP
jgi:hypothetical protein